MTIDLGFDALGEPLSNVTFVVVDLETNGGPPAEAGITEIGAVKVRGGEVIGEFQTLINPGTAIPPFIALLTGITDVMVGPAPKLPEVLPAFLEWIGDSVLVAHNAPFDIGFLKSACAKTGHMWPGSRVLDTVTLAKAALLRDEVPNRKLGTLAAYFGSPTEPVHRALADARATVHVMHALFERLGSLGYTTIDELLTLGTVIKPEQRKKRHLAQHLPSVPGVYVFQDDRKRALYIGTSRNIRKRAMSYFTGSETRERMSRMLGLADSIAAIPCATPLEARIRELRLIAETKPPFNAVGKRPEKTIWIRLTKEPYPRLSAVRQVKHSLGVFHFGPVRTMESAGLVIDAITSVVGIRTCTPKLSVTKPTSSCALGEMGRCSAPCELAITVDAYSELVAQLQTCLTGESSIEDALNQRISELSDQQRYEEAAMVRDRLAAWLDITVRHQRLSAITGVAEIVAAAPAETGWDIHIIRYGALSAAAHVDHASEVLPAVESLMHTARAFDTPEHPAPAMSVAESSILTTWLESEGVRLISLTGEWSLPVRSHLRYREELATMRTARELASSVVGIRKFAAFTAPR